MVITVGIPFHNCEKTILEAIRSVFAQSVDCWELLLVDDGSTDNSVAIASAVDDRRVSLVSDGQHRGLPYRLNQIAALARTPLLARMDADDLMHPDRLEQQASRLEAEPGVSLVDSPSYAIDGAGSPVGVYAQGEVDRRPSAVLRKTYLFHAAVTGYTEWFQRNPYRRDFPRAEDRELWCRTYERTRAVRVSTPLYYVRDHDSFALKKYLVSCATNRRIACTYGPGMVGWWGTARALAEFHLKSACYCAAACVGAEQQLVRRRYRPMPEPLAAAAREGLERIRATEVPTRDRVALASEGRR